MTSATEELRRLLDDRGVDWRAHTNLTRGAMELFHSTYFETPDGCMARVTSTKDSDLVLATFRTTPEQAIAATLGSGTCKNKATNLRTFWCDCCDCALEDWMDVGGNLINGLRYCPNCGAKVVN